MRVVLWGTYDTGKPRVRIIRRGLRENGFQVVECHCEVWDGVDDKSRLRGWLPRLAFFVRWMISYPWLIARYLCAPRHDSVIVAYMGHLDVLVLWPFAKLRGVPVIWDAFLSLYNTVVEDRAMASRRSPVALLLYIMEWLACRAADRVVLDTRAHADYFVNKFGISADRCGVVWVGAEPEVFPVAAKNDSHDQDERMVLFYGQFIPLHGIETIIAAARKIRDESIQWVIIGSGQEEERIRRIIEQYQLVRIKWLPWVSYPEISQWIHRADVCLGIFGETAKAARVIPNKVFQILMSGKPLITRDSPAIRELLDPEMLGVRLVPPANADALAAAVCASLDEKHGSGLYSAIREKIAPHSIGRRLSEVIHEVVRG